MKLNQLSEPVFSSQDLIKEIYKGNLSKIALSKINEHDIDYMSYIEFVNKNNLVDWPLPELYLGNEKPLSVFDTENQNNWFMPEEYVNFNIIEYLITLCKNDAELARVNEELELFKTHNMLDLLKFLKYLVDKMREDKILWGVGRGSSVASYCLYLLGIHKVDSIKYELDIREFLR